MRQLLKEIKLCVIKTRSAFFRFVLRCKGVQVHPTALITSMPYVKMAPNSTIIIGENVTIHSSPRMNPIIGRVTTAICTMSEGANIELQRDSGISGVCICAAREIILGEGSIVGGDAMIYDSDWHQLDDGYKWKCGIKDTAKPVHIGRGCFLAARAMVLKGVTLGDGVVVGAGAVVTKSVPAEHLVYGNPCQIRPLPEHLKRTPS